MSFEDIIGNEKNKAFLKKTIELNSIGHSYMFEGIEGIGKSLIAKEFAKQILCLNKNETNCMCKSCIQFNTNNNPDFIEVESDGKIIKIEQIRQMQEKILEKPIISEKKVYIINDADLMTKEAQNCLLKTLEEPPKYAVIILILANENKILNTIKSRCTKIVFEKIKESNLKEFALKRFEGEKIQESIIKNCGGSFSKLIKIQENIEEYEKLENFIKRIETENILDIINKADVLYKNKDIIDDILDYMTRLFYNKLNEDKMKMQYINIIEKIEDTKQKLKSNSNFDMSIDHLVFGMWEEINENSNRSKI